MKKISAIIVALIVLASCASNPEQKSPPLTEAVSIYYDSALKPFYHAVASGDPMTDRVIIWTRVTPDYAMKRIPVKWEISDSRDFSSIIKGDTISTTPERDYTVKVDVTGLEPGQTYYYRFIALDKFSPVGRTKTAPAGSRDSLKFAVVSCANWEWGYFSAYEKIAQRDDVDAVLHLGDYIYEYGTGTYGDTNPDTLFGDEKGLYP